ncbi:MAG: AAA family ATPase [Thermoproteota archaeon]|jgi:dephospho-CoA kinase|nr:AAA family ATPase [Thermoproteota archaeon]
MKIICITGMPLAGKTLASSFAKELGIHVISMGDKVRELGHDTARLIFEIREKHGRDAIARICGEEIKKLNKDVIVEGIRNIEEVEYFKTIGEVYLIAIHASPLTRFKRALNRKRNDDPDNFEEFKKRDERELSLGIGNVIAIADYMIVNEGTEEDLRKQFLDILKKILNA